MELNVREMQLDEVDVIIDYYHQSSSEDLEAIGIDPTRLPEPEKWLDRYALDYAKPIEKRQMFLAIWESAEGPVGFSTTDKIAYGQQATMHLHILNSQSRAIGIGARCLKETVKLYFEALQLQRLFCEPSAFNIAPNRTLQKTGFKYLKTYRTVPGPLSYEQAVTRWVFDKQNLSDYARQYRPDRAPD